MVLGLNWKFFSRGDFKVIISNYSSTPMGWPHGLLTQRP